MFVYVHMSPRHMHSCWNIKSGALIRMGHSRQHGKNKVSGEACKQTPNTSERRPAPRKIKKPFAALKGSFGEQKKLIKCRPFSCHAKLKLVQRTWLISHMGNYKQQMCWKFLAVATHFKFFFFVIYMSGTHGNACITETPEKHFLASLALSFSPSGRLKLTQHYSSVNTFSLTICLSRSLTRRHTHTQKKISSFSSSSFFSSPHSWPPDWPKVF